MAADAHSLVQFSDPPDGARLAHAPSAVLIMFTEAPDPKLSQVQILDTTGRRVAGGPMSPLPGAPTTVAIALPPLGDGVYTVSWRTVSAPDGHAATGPLAFLPTLAAGPAPLAAWRLQGNRRQVALGICAGLGAVAMLANAAVSHAAASPLAWLMIPAHWLHVMSYAVWIGGLAAVLVGIRGLPTVDKARAVGRFSRVAGFAFAAMILTGVIRGIDEVGSWSNLFTTTFGWLLLAKTALFFTIAPLAATNRWRYVRLGVEGIPHLRWISRGELGLAAGIMVAAAFLTTLPPPSFVREVAAQNFPHLVVDGADYGSAVRVNLDAAPGYPGLNRFTVTVHDAKTGRPVSGARLFLLFDLPARPAIGESYLELRGLGNGIYTAEGTRLSLAGSWTVTVVVETASTSYDAVLPIKRAERP